MLKLAVANIVIALRNVLNMEFRGQVGVEFVGDPCRVILVGEFCVPVGDTGLLVEVNERDAVAGEEHHLAAGLLHCEIRLEIYHILPVFLFENALELRVVAGTVGVAHLAACAALARRIVDVATEEVDYEKLLGMLLKECDHIVDGLLEFFGCACNTVIAVKQIVAVETRTQVDTADTAVELLAHRNSLGGRRGVARGTVGVAGPVFFAGSKIVCTRDGYVGNKHVVGKVGHPVFGLTLVGGGHELSVLPCLVPGFAHILVGPSLAVPGTRQG